MKKFIKEDLIGLLTCLAIVLIIVLLFVGGFYLAKLIGGKRFAAVDENLAHLEMIF